MTKPHANQSDDGRQAASLPSSTGGSVPFAADLVDAATRTADQLPQAAGAVDPRAEDEVFSASPVLMYVRALARARMVRPLALLAVLVTRLISLTAPSWRIPAFVGTEASLNSFVALLGTPGSGKTTVVCLVDEILGQRAAELSPVITPSTGEGLLELFKDRSARGGRAPRTMVMAHWDEVEMLGAQARRTDSTLMSSIRSAWTGAAVSQHAADESRQRSLERHAYRFCAVVGVQESTAYLLTDERGGGTPQRFWWVSMVDPEGGADHVAPPVNPFDGWQPLLGGGLIQFPSSVEKTVRDNRVAVLRGTAGAHDVLANHSSLLTIKLAAGLAVLCAVAEPKPDDGRDAPSRLAVEEWQWEVAQLLSRWSYASMSHAEEYQRSVAEARAARQGAVDDIRTHARAEAKLDRVARCVARFIARRGTPQDRSAIRKGAMAASDRPLCDDAIARAVDEGWIAPDRGLANTYVAGHVDPELGD